MFYVLAQTQNLSLASRAQLTNLIMLGIVFKEFLN